MTERAPLEQWVIYNHPLDHPDFYVARLWLIDADGMRPSEVTPYLDPYLDNVRRFVQTIDPNLVCIGRRPGDDPVIVEVWT